MYRFLLVRVREHERREYSNDTNEIVWSLFVVFVPFVQFVFVHAWGK